MTLSDFRSGRGEPVEISKDALDHANQVFVMDTTPTPPSSQSKTLAFDTFDVFADTVMTDNDDYGLTSFAGFTTGSGKSVEVSRESLEKAKKIISVEDNVGDVAMADDVNNNDLKEKKDTANTVSIALALWLLPSTVVIAIAVVVYVVAVFVVVVAVIFVIGIAVAIAVAAVIV